MLRNFPVQKVRDKTVSRQRCNRQIEGLLVKDELRRCKRQQLWTVEFRSGVWRDFRNQDARNKTDIQDKIRNLSFLILPGFVLNLQIFKVR